MSQQAFTTRLPIDCQSHILTYLGLKDLSKLELVAHCFHDLIHRSDFPQQYLLEHFFSSSSSTTNASTNITTTSSSSSSSSSYVFPPIRIHSACSIYKELQQRICQKEIPLDMLVVDVLDASSIDREEESPRNILEDSLCYTLFHNYFTQNHAYSQFYCGCADGRPCYWSSAPNPSENSIEFLTLNLQSTVSLLTGFFILPYCAFFHPNEPTYAPKEVALQVISPSSQPQPFSSMTMTDLPPQYRHAAVDLYEGVSYTSPFYTVENNFNVQTFQLPHAVPCLGGQVRLLFRGKHQRQPGEAIGVQGADDFYLCISRADVLGIALLSADLVPSVSTSARLGDLTWNLHGSDVTVYPPAPTDSQELGSETCRDKTLFKLHL
eukprot:scaffold1187_cov181-Ochromonas_danica.AAC.24